MEYMMNYLTPYMACAQPYIESAKSELSASKKRLHSFAESNGWGYAVNREFNLPELGSFYPYIIMWGLMASILSSPFGVMFAIMLSLIGVSIGRDAAPQLFGADVQYYTYSHITIGWIFSFTILHIFYGVFHGLLLLIFSSWLVWKMGSINEHLQAKLK